MGFNRWSAAIATAVAAATCVWLTVGTALAAEGNTLFKNHYQHNAEIETSLLQKAQSVSSNDPKVAALENTVQNLNRQVTTLYTVEQSLVDEASNAPSLSASDVSNLKLERDNLSSKLQTISQKIRTAQSQNDNAKVERLSQRRSSILKQIAVIDSELGGKGTASSQQIQGGVQQLQAVIYHLQAAAIHYTNQWIRVESNVTLGPVSSVSGLIYAQTSINIPAAGSPAAVDVVATQPIVKDGDGNMLNDAGVFSITGPNTTGISIDLVTGTVQVRASAVPGNYTVTYEQDGASEQVTLTLS